MLACTDCGAVFEENELKPTYENYPDGEGNVTQTFEVCPNCGEGGIEEAVRCQHCGDYGLAENMKHSEATEMYLCDICYGDLYGE